MEDWTQSLHQHTAPFIPHKMNSKVRLVTSAALLAASAAYGAPFLAVGDGAEIFLTGTVETRSDGNIYMAPKASNTLPITAKDRDDVVFEVTPGLEWNFGKNSAIQGTWSVQEKIVSFADHSDLNTNLLSSYFNSSYSDGKTKGAFNASYSESSQNQATTTATSQSDYLIESNNTTVGGSGEVKVTEKTAIAAGLNYSFTDYALVGFADSEVVKVPLDVYYEVSPKVDLGVGYQFRQSWLKKNAPDSTDNTFHVSTRGEFTPKLSGTLNVGYVQRDFKYIKDANMLGFSANMSYVASPKTTMQFGVSRDFEANSQGQQQKNLAINASSSTKLSEQWSVNLSASYQGINYFQATPARTDDFFTARVGASYIVNAYATLSAYYNYNKNRSDLEASNFDANVFAISANLRY